MSQTIQALIVDEAVNSRNRLRQAVIASSPFIEVRVALTVRDALDIATEMNATHLFLSSELLKTHGDDFLTKFATLEGKVSYIMVLQGEQRAPAVIIERFANGVDGFILDPYSAEDIRLVLEQTKEIQGKDTSLRRDAAIRFLLKGSTRLIDQAAVLKLSGKGLGEMTRDIRRQREALERLKPEDNDKYFDMIYNAFQNAPVTALHEATRLQLEKEKALKDKIEAADLARREEAKRNAATLQQRRVIRKR